MLVKHRHPIAWLLAPAFALVMSAAALSAQSVSSAAVGNVESAVSRGARTPTRWQFATFTSNFGGGGYSWTTGTERIGDGNYRKFLAKLGLLGLVDHPSGELALFDEFGAQGWELISCQTVRLPGVLSESDVTTCYFKRPVSGQRAASSAP